MEQVEICRSCANSTPLSDCTVQAHWEKRLRDYRLMETRAFRPLMTNADGDQVDRTVPLSTQDADKVVVGPMVVPDNEEVAEVFVMDSLGLSYPAETKRFWPFQGAIHRSAIIKTHRMGLVYGQDMPGEKESL